MPSKKVFKDETDQSVYFEIIGDAGHATPGEPVTGLLFSDIETGGSASYTREGAARVDFSLVTLASASAAHTDGGFILVDDTNAPGLYRCDVPDAAFVTGVEEVIISIVVASANNALARPVRVQMEKSTTPKINTALSDIPFYMELTAGGPGTGLTVTARRSLNGGTVTAATGTVTELEDGYYMFDATAADMNGAACTLLFSEATCRTSAVALTTRE